MISLRLKSLAVGLLLASAPAWADVKLPALFSDHMVLKADANVPLWGKADPGEEVTVSMDGQTVKATAGADGKWKVLLNLRDSKPGPFEMTVTVTGKNRLKISDVAVGETWLASGQSNMYWKLNIGPYTTVGGAEEAARSANPMLRVFEVPMAATQQPQDDCKGSWLVAGPATTGQFSAIGYYFAKKLQNELKVPVGLIVSSVGGTEIEGWTSRQARDDDPEAMATKRRLWKNFADYPADKQKFLADFPAWLKAHGREDKPAPDAQAYAAPGISTAGWVPIQDLPGLVSGNGLPAYGAIWLRREITIPEKILAGGRATDYPLQISLGAMAGFESIYWNGQLVSHPTLDQFGGEGSAHAVTIPVKSVRDGPNTLAVRVFSPVAPFHFPTAPSLSYVGGMADQWLAKAEYALPPLDAATVASVPQPPPAIPDPVYGPGFLFNGMIHPLIPYALSGIAWYQGESNTLSAYRYRFTFPLLIQDWRQHWGDPGLPFYFCQISGYGAKLPQPGESMWAELRESQGFALKIPHTAEAVLIDLGESDDPHYRRKREAGERLALVALAHSYGKKIPSSGPVYSSMKVEDGKIRVHFDHREGGLVAHPLPATYPVRSSAGITAPLVPNRPKSQLEGFAICADDRKWVWADAKIDGDSVLVWSDQVPKPAAVRYGWADYPIGNLYNAAGLPASPFRTDDFPLSTLNGKAAYPGDSGK